jgi:hypothetical protein
MLEIHVNADEVISTLDNLAVNQIPFALANALYRTATDFQKAERERFDAIFSLRRKSFIELQGVKLLSGYPNKRKLFVTLGQDPRADFLGKFEEGGEKTPTQADDIAIPEDVRVSKSDIVINSQRPKALFASGAPVFEIKPGDDNAHLAPGIYQRMGRGGRTLRKLYALQPSVPIAATLGFEETAQQVVNDRWAINFSEAFQDAMETAR